MACQHNMVADDTFLWQMIPYYYGCSVLHTDTLVFNDDVRA
jgi:hypothetical protein